MEKSTAMQQQEDFAALISELLPPKMPEKRPLWRRVLSKLRARHV